MDRLLVGKFLNKPSGGEWTLGVLDTVNDGSNGTVRGWSLRLTVKPCNRMLDLR